MQFYLSSFGLGDQVDALKRMAAGRTVGFVPNAFDNAEPQIRAERNGARLAELQALGIDVETLDLASYFADPHGLRAAVAKLDGLWIRGGSAFVLRKAMRLSGFDILIHDLLPTDFLYAGYSAGICVLAPRLDGLKHVDDPHAIPYADRDPVWEGLGILDYLILPHFRSNHPESALIDKDVAYCQSEGIPFRTLRDGEVIIMEAFGSIGSA
jgi:dipeptidase E